MPYKLSGNCVVKQSDGSTVPGGCHKSHAQAVAHLAALEVNVHDAKGKGYNPSQPRDPKGSPTGGRWSGAAAGIRGALAKAGGKLRSLAGNAKIAPSGPVLLANGATQPLSRLEKLAINQGIKQLVGRIPISNKAVRIALGIAANMFIPRLIARLSPAYKKIAMAYMYSALISTGFDALATILRMASGGRKGGGVDAELKRVLDQMRPVHMSKTELDALVSSYGSRPGNMGGGLEDGFVMKEADGGLEDSAAKVAALLTQWVEEDKAKNAKKEVSVFTSKEADGKYRWTVIGSGAYGPDRDGEWMTEKALRGWSNSFPIEPGTIPVRANGEHVALRWWHVGTPDPETLSKGPGIDLGVCDFAAVHSKSLVMSGTFDDPEIGEVISQNLDKLGASIGFFHPQSQPVNKEFHTIDVYEVSLLPVERASYPFTGLTIVKGN